MLIKIKRGAHRYVDVKSFLGDINENLLENNLQTRYLHLESNS